MPQFDIGADNVCHGVPLLHRRVESFFYREVRGLYFCQDLECLPMFFSNFSLFTPQPLRSSGRVAQPASFHVFRV